jgi:predicted AAA+ superfamily ATPase
MTDILRKLRTSLDACDRSVLLLGPRQVGKSTLLQSLKPDLVINLASEREYFQFSSHPGRLESLLEAENPRRVLIDEIQRIPSLLNSVQFWVDHQKSTQVPTRQRTQFLLSGSSARKLRKGQANLAPGRLRVFHLGGLAANELNYHLDCRRALSVGTLPEPYLVRESRTAEILLRDYSSTYLTEEIQAEALTRNLAGFSRFLLVLAEHSGNILDLSKLSSKAKVSRTSALRFIEILEDTLIAQRIESHVEAGEADVIRHPKFFFFDPGVLNGLLENFTASADRSGRLMEHLVYSQIRNSLNASDRRGKVEFFRTRNGVEVDFVVTLEQNEVWAIEVKAGQVSDEDLKPLLIFRDYLPYDRKRHLKLAVVSLAESRRRVRKDCAILGLNELLREMRL